jgi:hypothetical protein
MLIEAQRFAKVSNTPIVTIDQMLGWNKTSIPGMKKLVK